MRLSQAEIDNLIALHKQLNRQKDADKLKCIIYWGKGYSWEQIKELLFLSDGTIKNYIDAYKNGGTENLLQTNYKGQHYKLSPAQEKVLANYVEKHNVLNSKQAVKYVKTKFGVAYTINGMTKTLIRLGFSYKKPKRAPAKWDSYKEASFKLAYYMKSCYLPENKAIYFMDASGFEHNSKIDYGWIRKGKNKHVKTNTGRKRLNVNGAYDIKNHTVISICQEGNVNTESNINLMKKIVSLNTDKDLISIILDCASMNKSEAIFDFVREQNKKKTKIELVFTPPYSPHLNLIERLWRFSKKKLLSNQFYSSYLRFRQAIEDFFERKINKFKKELETLMTENFQTISRCGKLLV